MFRYKLLICHDPNTNAAALLNAIHACGARLRYRENTAPNILSLPPPLCPQQVQDYFWKVREVVWAHSLNSTS